MRSYLVLLATVLFFQTNAQQNKLALFDHLVGKVWNAEGEWGDGSKFKQEKVFRYSLDSTLVLAETKGFTNHELTAYGQRNHGIRKYDQKSNSIKFWEFDIFGGVTEGSVKSMGKDIIYTYAYGESILTNYWEYVDENTYNFTVGSYKDGRWEQTYLKTQFVSQKPNFDFQLDHYAIAVTQLVKTGDFYRDVFGLTEIPVPDNFVTDHRWFQMNEGAQLHLIEKEIVEFKKDKSVHLCFSTQNFEGFVEHLKVLEIDFYDWKGNKNSISNHRSDGVKQIYIQDPDGYWVEVNNAKH